MQGRFWSLILGTFLEYSSDGISKYHQVVLLANAGADKRSSA